MRSQLVMSHMESKEKNKNVYNNFDNDIMWLNEDLT